MKFFGYVNFFVIFCSLVVWMNDLKSVLLSFDGLGFAKFAWPDTSIKFKKFAENAKPFKKFTR